LPSLVTLVLFSSAGLSSFFVLTLRLASLGMYNKIIPPFSFLVLGMGAVDKGDAARFFVI